MRAALFCALALGVGLTSVGSARADNGGPIVNELEPRFRTLPHCNPRARGRSKLPGRLPRLLFWTDWPKPSSSLAGATLCSAGVDSP
jgi:hypothetical protein